MKGGGFHQCLIECSKSRFPDKPGRDSLPAIMISVPRVCIAGLTSRYQHADKSACINMHIRLNPPTHPHSGEPYSILSSKLHVHNIRYMARMITLNGVTANYRFTSEEAGLSSESNTAESRLLEKEEACKYTKNMYSILQV